MNSAFSKDPSFIVRLFNLLDVVFPGIRRVANNARAMGASWESVSTPFVCFEGEQVISHVGVIELPLVLLGRPVRVGSIHGVATHPRHRGRGHFRQAIEAALRYADSRYETLILTTENPEYFQPFGFRVIREHLFRFKPDAIESKDGLQLIDTANASDVELLHRLLDKREPVSNVLGVASEKGVFCFNEGSRSLYYVRELDVILCMEIEEARLKLFDIVGPNVPSLMALLERIPYSFEEVLINFSPDKLSIESEPIFHLFDHDGPSYFMARGPLDVESHAFSLPRSART